VTDSKGRIGNDAAFSMSYARPGSSGMSVTALPSLTGKSVNPVQPRLQKYFASPQTQISNISLTVPSHRGALARSSRTRGGMRWTLMALQDDRRLRWTAKSCGPDAPTLVSSWRVSRKRRWQPSMVTGESTKETVKTIACGNAGRSRLYPR
jgi:hypothetical protein